MASLLLRPLLRPQVLGLGLSVSMVTYHTLYLQRPMRLDSSPIPGPSRPFSRDSSRQDTQTSVAKGGLLNPGAVGQISSGSIVGELL